MMIALIGAAEIGFWVVLAAGLSVRYLLRRPRAGAVLLLCVPLIDVLLLTATGVDLARGAEPAFGHGLAALYLGFTVAYGHYVITWADGHFAHRFGGAPKPAKPPRHGWARARHEWRIWRMTLIAVAISLAVLHLLGWLADGSGSGSVGEADVLREWQARALVALAVHGLIALSYTVWQKQPPAPPAQPAPSRSPVPPAGTERGR
jgi:hypothetical protein